MLRRVLASSCTAANWRVENGEIVGETTPQNVAKTNSFLIWRGGTVRDFELKVEFRMNGTNSGIQYRSTELPNIGKWTFISAPSFRSSRS
jgi:hypothetical protein